MDQLTQIPLTLCTVKAGLAAGTTSTYSTTGTTVYAIKGRACSTAAKANVATPVVDVVDGLPFTPQLPGQGSVYVFGFDAGGTLRVAQGSIEQLDVSGAFITLPQFPIVPDTVCPFGFALVRAAPASAATPAVAPWLFGTNNLSGVTGVTVAFVDVMTLPERPQAA